MIGYVIFGTNDLDKASTFYDAVFAPLGHDRCFDGGSFRTWGKAGTMGEFAVSKPYNGEPATVGNGSMVALTAPDRATVDAVYASALEMGGTCEGAPGPRGDDGFYAAYFRDLDGNKFNCFVFG